MVSRLRSNLWIVSALLLFVAACNDGPVGLEEIGDLIDDILEEREIRPPDPVAGKAAFEASCAACHASGDAFDLAYFSFSDFDIVRRGVAHVDTSTAEDIVAFVRSHEVNGVARETPPFQPGERLLVGDRSFWRGLFGTDAWPGTLTVEDLRAIDPREVSAPIRLPTWSSELNELDWMPEMPLPADLLTLESGALASAIETYRGGWAEYNLIAALTTFRRLTTGPGALCEGEAAVHTYPTECFEARRWISSLAAIHYLRVGSTGPLPFEVAQAFWDTGEAAVSIWARLDRTHNPRLTAALWLYLGFIAAPEGFSERAGYLGQHLQTLGYPRLATFTALRRMVGNGPAHLEADQRFWDAFLAISRAPNDLAMHVARFAYTYLRDGLVTGSPAQDPAFARQLVQQGWSLLVSKGATGADTALDAEVMVLRDELSELLH
ncbi:MAG TPA: cytochrome c [Rhodothermales bacterium]|nr:cytochrome c [Rhodothermales bacterium]